MIWDCPGCEKDKITYWNKFKMYGVYKTKCPHCGSRLGTTPKWDMLVLLPAIVFCFLIIVFIAQDMQGYTWLTVLVNTLYQAVIVWFRPLTVKELRKEPEDRSHIEI